MAKVDETNVDVDDLGTTENDDTLVSELGDDITEGGTGKVKSKPAAAVDDATDRRLRQLEFERIEQNVKAKFLGELHADPEISEILRARQSGKKIKIIPAEEAEEQKIPAADIDGMSNSQLMEHLEGRMGKSLENRVTKAIEPLVRQMQSVNSKVREAEETGVSKEIATLRRTARDFDLLQPSMIEISARNPDLSVTEVYDVAKRRAGGVGTVAERKKQQGVVSERPSGGASRGNQRAKLPAEVPSVRPSFKSLVTKSLESLDLKEAGKADFGMNDDEDD